MKIVKCSYGHFFDAEKFDRCPCCTEGENKAQIDRGDIGDQKTIAKSVSRDMDFGSQLTERYLESVRDDEKTLSLDFIQNKCRPIAGWLVCISGIQRGKSFSISSGRNFAGRAKAMDIRLTDDEMISRENHFSIVFDPKSIKFVLVAGNGETQLNGKTISGAVNIRENDKIEVGQTKYLFVPYCKEERNWNEKN